MGRSQESFNKKEVRKRKEKKKKEKAEKKQARKESESSSSFDDMIAYVDEHGNITDTPPDPSEREEIKAEDIEISPPKRDPADDLSAERKGTVSFFNDSKGFGFIKDDQLKEDVFVHVSNCAEEIHEGNKVTFETEKGPKGPVAINVKIIR